MLQPISKKSLVLDNFFKNEEIKKSHFQLERVHTGKIEREDPFKNEVSNDIWFLFEGKLIKNNKYKR